MRTGRHGVYDGRRRRKGFRVLLALVLVAVLCFGILEAVVLSGGRDEIDGQPQTMVILGCQVKSWGPSVLLQDRLDKALAYLEDHPDMTVIVSGGQGADEPSTEALAMRDYLVERGVDPGRIIQEDQSHNTMQNLIYTRALMEEHRLSPEDGVLVVSNGFHLTRVRMLAERFGLGPVSTLAAPSTHAPSRWKMYIREPLALVKSFVFDR